MNLMNIFSFRKYQKSRRDFFSNKEKRTYDFTVISLFTLIILSILYGLYSSYKAKMSTNNTILYGLLEALFTFLIGISVSVFISSLLATLQTFSNIDEKQDTIKKEKFKNFFGCKYQGGEDDKNIDKVAIILPSYPEANNNGNKLTKEQIENAIKQLEASSQFANISSDDYAVNMEKYATILNSIKVPEEQLASFSQSDTIAAANIVALFSRMSMRPPTIRTDLQGIFKIFQFTNADSNISRQEDDFLKEIEHNMGKGFLNDTGLFKGENHKRQAKEFIAGKNPKGASYRHYNTYISIGMFSNSFLMDFINNNIQKKVEKCFTCVTRMNKNTKEISQMLYLSSSIDESEENIMKDPLYQKSPQHTEPIVLDKHEQEKLDYALITKAKFNDYNIFICAGISVEGTMAASSYLANNWESIEDKVGNDVFAIVLQIDPLEWNHKTVSKQSPTLDFPNRTFARQQV